MHYDRDAAVNYAGWFWNNVCHDGYVATKTTKTGYAHFKPGTPLSDANAFPEEDCAHFISCCIGQTNHDWEGQDRIYHIRGGGINLDSPIKRQFGIKVYGETYVPRLVGALLARGAKIIGRPFMETNARTTLELISKHMRPGDVMAYGKLKDPKHRDDHYEHAVLCVKSTTIACHTYSRYDEPFTSVEIPRITLLKMPG
jgi:hypothetical protein